jgi:hypothetical protein
VALRSFPTVRKQQILGVEATHLRGRGAAGSIEAIVVPMGDELLLVLLDPLAPHESGRELSERLANAV